MVSEDPVETSGKGSRTVRVRGATEVPDRASGRDNELGHTNDEGIKPEISEQDVEEDVSGLIVPLDG